MIWGELIVSSLKHLKKLSPWSQAIQSEELKELSLQDVKFDAKITATLQNVHTLFLHDCSGDVSSLLTQAAQTLTNLTLIRTCLNTHVAATLPNLMVLYLITADEHMISLMTRSALKLTKFRFRDVFTSPLLSLKYLSLNDCDGYINSLLAAASFSLEYLDLQSVDLETQLYLPMPNLKAVKIANEEIDIRKVHKFF